MRKLLSIQTTSSSSHVERKIEKKHLFFHSSCLGFFFLLSLPVCSLFFSFFFSPPNYGWFTEWTKTENYFMHTQLFNKSSSTQFFFIYFIYSPNVTLVLWYFIVHHTSLYVNCRLSTHLIQHDVDFDFLYVKWRIYKWIKTEDEKNMYWGEKR